MPKPRAGAPIPSPLDAVQKMLQTGAVGGRGGAASEEAPGEADTTGQQGNKTPWQQGNRATGQQDALATGQQGNMLTGRQGARATGQARLSRAGWEVQTMYLPSDLRRWLKIESAMQAREIGEIVTEILREYLARRG